MRRGEAQQQFIAINRWWRDPTGWPMADPDLREVEQAPFDYRANVLTDLAPGGLYVLRGPRRVGKTVEIKRSGLLVDQRTRSCFHTATDTGFRRDHQRHRRLARAHQMAPSAKPRPVAASRIRPLLATERDLVGQRHRHPPSYAEATAE